MAVPTFVQHVDVNMAETETQQNNPGLLTISARTAQMPNIMGIGNCVIVSVFNSGNVAPTVTDDGGNSYTQLTNQYDSAEGQSLTTFAALITNASRIITVHWATGVSFTAIKATEFYNATAVDVHNVATITNATITGGSVTPTVSGDLLYMVGFEDSVIGANTLYTLQTQANITWGFVPCSTQSIDGSFAIYGQYNSTAAIAPKVAASGTTRNYLTATIALKTGTQGTPPTSGIRVVGVQHIFDLPTGLDASNTIQFVTAGNLQVFLSTGDDPMSSITSTGANTAAWEIRANLDAAQILDSINTTPGIQTLTITYAATSGGAHDYLLLDVAGAATSPYDKTALSAQDQTSNTVSSVSVVSISPSTANGLLVNCAGLDYQNASTLIGGAGYNSLVSWETAAAGSEDYSESDENDGYGIIYNTGTGSYTFDYNLNTIDPGYTGVVDFSAAAVAYKAAPATIISVSDSGTGSDSVSVASSSQTLSVSDAGAGSDAVSVSQAGVISITDVGTGSDAVSQILVSLGVSDSGHGSDTTSLSGSGINAISDSGTGVDSVSLIRVSLSVQDSGSGVDSMSGAGQGYIPTFPPIPPDYSPTDDVQAQVLQNKFGDGYSQRAAQGLNNVAQVWSLTWTNQPIIGISEIESFIVAAQGWQSFYWTPPRQSVPLLFICQKWHRTESGPTTANFSATFEQVFDIV